MNAAQREMAEEEATFAPGGVGVLREQVADRLAAHRVRRGKAADAARVGVEAQLAGRRGGGRGEAIAAAVAERYAHTQTYREFLAAEAEKAIRLAEVAADEAARSAAAVAAAQRELMEELARGEAVLETVGAEETMVPAVPVAALPTAGMGRPMLTVRLYEDVGRPEDVREAEALVGPGRAERRGDQRRDSAEGEDAEERRALDEEIAFRQSPTVELARPNVAIPGNLLEFPRHLVASRKARPRYAEGPLREDGSGDDPQLRIFEVTAEQVSAAPAVESVVPEWSSIWLDAPAQEDVGEAAAEKEAVEAMRPQTASMERRVMATMVDGCLVGMGFVGFATMFAWMAVRLPGVGMLAAAGAGVLAGMFVLYQMLFFTLGEATPGMRYARIGLCTLADENPTRAAMRWRVPALVLAACPLGMGFAWAWLDKDGLGWHDRLSKMYQRSY